MTRGDKARFAVAVAASAAAVAWFLADDQLLPALVVGLCASAVAIAVRARSK